MAIELSDIVIGGGITVVGSGLVAFGVIKGKLSNFLTFGKHNEICHQKTTEIYTQINANYKSSAKERSDMMLILGDIKGQLKRINGGR